VAELVSAPVGVSEIHFFLPRSGSVTYSGEFHSCGPVVNDDRAGRFSLSARLGVTGTLGVLDMASRAGLLDEKKFADCKGAIFRYPLRSWKCLLEERKNRKKGKVINRNGLTDSPSEADKSAGGEWAPICKDRLI